MIVVDASALVEALMRFPAAEAVDAWLFAPHESLHAPHLIDIEVVQVIRRYAARRDADFTRIEQALDDLDKLSIQRYPHRQLLPRVWELRDNLTAYDAAYIALAEFLDVPLLTHDPRMANAAGHRARIELV